MVLSVDFDGTCVTHEYPNVGKNIGAEIVLREISLNHDIICVSMRSDEQVDSTGIDTIKAIKNWFKKEGIELTAINDNPEQKKWSKSRKIYANIYIDDQFLGCPLQMNTDYSDRPFVNWFKIAILLRNIGVFSERRTIAILDELKAKYPKLYGKYEYNNLSI